MPSEAKIVASPNLIVACMTLLGVVGRDLHRGVAEGHHVDIGTEGLLVERDCLSAVSVEEYVGLYRECHDAQR